MKRCPACKRVENDDALVFCRADGTPLVSDSGPVSAEAGTVRFGSAPVASETETSIPAQTVTDADMSRPTAPTTVLDRRKTIGGTRELSRPKWRRATVLILVATVIVAIAGLAYYYYAHKDSAAINSIAVLPFQNASGDSNMEYLSDGIAESLMNSLSQLPNLKVTSRNTAFRYKSREQDTEKVGKELNVRAVLTGSLKQVGDQIVISVSLDDAFDGRHIWGAQYDRKASDLLSVQREIARDITGNLRLRLSGADEQKLAKNHTVNPEAYQLYLKGRFYWNKRTPDNFRKAIDYFNQAIALDPNYALAYVGLADAYALLSTFGALPSREATLKARESALTALSLEPSLGEPHATLGLLLTDSDFDFTGAEREFQRAIELNPNYATAHQWFGEMLGYAGRFQESFAEFRRALEIDPMSLPINWNYGRSLYYARRYDESLAQLKKTVELDANFASVHRSLSYVYQSQGNYAQSI
jgi:TolB-like protein/Tfp pilus assembly protein PilF